MPYIAPEVITEAKRMDLLTYLREYEPNELVKYSNNTYTTRTHDSLKISNGKWMWWSRGIGGKSALDYLIKVRGMDFVEAVQTIMGNSSVRSPTPENAKGYVNQPLLLPERSPTTDVVFEYLFGRGIDYEIINYCLEKELVIESLPYHNVVFIGYDESNKPKYAAYRATNQSRLMGDCTGSKKQYSFRLTAENTGEVHLFECAIDLLSYATLMKLEGSLILFLLPGCTRQSKISGTRKCLLRLENCLKKTSQLSVSFSIWIMILPEEKQPRRCKLFLRISMKSLTIRPSAEKMSTTFFVSS